MPILYPMTDPHNLAPINRYSFSIQPNFSTYQEVAAREKEESETVSRSAKTFSLPSPDSGVKVREG